MLQTEFFGAFVIANVFPYILESSRSFEVTDGGFPETQTESENYNSSSNYKPLNAGKKILQCQI